MHIKGVCPRDVSEHGGSGHAGHIETGKYYPSQALVQRFADIRLEHALTLLPEGGRWEDKQGWRERISTFASGELAGQDVTDLGDQAVTLDSVNPSTALLLP